MANDQQADQRALYVISVAAELAGVHPQTLRIYERKGLIEPRRTEGRSRRYSDRDIALLRRIQELTTDGVSLAGVRKILDLEAELDQLRQRIAALDTALSRRARGPRGRGPRRAPQLPPRPRAGQPGGGAGPPTLTGHHQGAAPGGRCTSSTLTRDGRSGPSGRL